MPCVQLKIVNTLGLHARAAAKFVGCAKRYSSEVTLSFQDQNVDGKSIMSVMLLAAPLGSEINLEVSGEDEAQAMEALVALVNGGFGEGR